MWIELPTVWLIVLNVVGVPVVHLLISWWTTNLPAERFDPDRWWCRPRVWERSGRLYETVFRVRRWKGLLPDAAPWFQGFPKAKLRSSDPRYLREFQIETCRGEYSHWWQMMGISCFVLWNPWPASLIMVVYAVLSNFPCIITQRHTRLRLGRVLNSG